MHAAASETEYQSFLAAFVQGLRQSGWIEGQNLHVEVRWNAENAGLAQTYAADQGGPVCNGNSAVFLPGRAGGHCR
jgi:hypothetical protein